MPNGKETTLIQQVGFKEVYGFNSMFYDRDKIPFSDADLLACSVHAALYTGGRKNQVAKVQQKINEPCTAVAVTKDKLYIAFNSVDLKILKKRNTKKTS